MPLIETIDGPSRRIFLHLDTVGTSINPIDIYKEMRALRRTDENLRKFDVFLEGAGNVAKGGGKFTERYVIEKNGTRIVPYDTTQELTITGTIITDDGQEGIACFDRSPLNPATVVDINYVPPQVEVIEITTGGGVGTPAEVADAVWQAVYNGKTMQAIIDDLRLITNNKVTKAGEVITIYEDDGVTVWKQYDLTAGERLPV